MKILLSLILSASLVNSVVANELKKVFISQYVDHPALDMTVKGIVDGLAKKGYKQGENLELKIKSAQGNSSLAAQIAKNFVGEKADIVVGVPTASSQSLIKYAKENKIKLVFSSVTDPLKAGLVKSLTLPGNNTSGVSNYVDLEPQIELFKKVQPDLRILGFLYNSSEINSLAIKEKLEIICSKHDMKLVSQTVSKTSEIAQATNKLASNTDAIFISNDNTALSALQAIIKIAGKVKIPVYVSDVDAVEQGALAALGPNQYNIGLQTADIIARALEGEDLENIAVEFPSTQEIYLNEKTAEKLKIKFGEDLKKIATKIIR